MDPLGLEAGSPRAGRRRGALAVLGAGLSLGSPVIAAASLTARLAPCGPVGAGVAPVAGPPLGPVGAAGLAGGAVWTTALGIAISAPRSAGRSRGSARLGPTVTRNRHLCAALRCRAGPAGRDLADGHPDRRRAAALARGLHPPAGRPGPCGCCGGIRKRARWSPAGRHRRLLARAVRTAPDEPGGRTARVSPDRQARRQPRPSEPSRLLPNPGLGRRRPRPWAAGPWRPARSRCRRHAG